MPQFDPNDKPRLRYVEANLVDTTAGCGFVLNDPQRLAAGSVTVNEPTLFILSRFDGSHTIDEVCDAFAREYCQPIGLDQIVELLNTLDAAHLLAGESFDRYYDQLVSDYRNAPARVMDNVAELGLQCDPIKSLRRVIDASPTSWTSRDRIVGLISPHLDYERGEPCYSAAFSTLLDQPAPKRVLFLGTNHFGRSCSVVATGKDFETPLGVTRADRAFLESIESRVGNLRRHEFDHQREHSVELQLLLCQRLWGADDFEMCAFLCPDPCGPTGTLPIDGEGVDMKAFACALGEAIRADDADTLVIAGADLSHVGRHFGDECELDEAFLDVVRRSDLSALDYVAANQPDAFLKLLCEKDNATRVCSAGCISALMFALPDAKLDVLRYHQAVDDCKSVGVTCAAAVATLPR